MRILHTRKFGRALFLGAGVMSCGLTAAWATQPQTPAAPVSSPPAVTTDPVGAKAAPTTAVSSPNQIALKQELVGTETDKDGTYQVFKMTPPYAGWSIKSLLADNATVVLTPEGLEVSWIYVNIDKNGKPSGRTKTIDVVPFDIVSTTVTFTATGTEWKDARGHVFRLDRPTSKEHPVEIGF